MKKGVLFTLIIGSIGIIVGLVLSYGVYFGLNATGGAKFCIVCHEMDPMVAAYKRDVHGGIGKTGVAAQCVDCHIPHDNLFKYIFTKAKNGVVEGAIHFFGDVDGIDWHKNRKLRESFVFDNGCLKCHTNILESKASSEQAQKMHARYSKLLGSDKELKCASCHTDVGHRGLRNILNYYKPEYEIYEKKMVEKKKEIEKELYGKDK